MNNKSNLIYNKSRFYSYTDNKIFDSFVLNQNIYNNDILWWIEKFSEIEPTNKGKKKEKETVYNAATKL